LQDPIAALQYAQKYQKIEFYEPYEYQKEYFKLKDKTGKLARIRALMAGNQIGKTLSNCAEVAYHVTGLYPSWWEGWRFTQPVNWLIGGVTNDATRDILQKELFGEPSDKDSLGTGAIQKHLIVSTDRKPGVPNAFDAAIIKHASGGNSKLFFRGYEQGPSKIMGLRLTGALLDEEPPHDFYTQCLARTIATNGIIMLSFTPEQGVTALVHQVMYEPADNMGLLVATWDDAPHLTEERKQELLESFPPHEREMRSKGIPMVGTGLIFPVADEDIIVEPFEIPKHWRRGS
jgi:phage terminase large subunit-like protein